MFKLSRHLMAVLLVSTIMLLAACGNSNNKEAESSSPEASKALQSSAESEQFEAAVAEYHQFVIGQTDQFVKATQAFVDAVKAGDIELAKKLYAPARMYFERIEPIAESLGDFDPWIDAREGDVPDDEWRGYHKLEKALWIENSTAGHEEIADQLLQDVKQLRVKIESVEITTVMLVTGAVELLNEVSSSKVTGEEEQYSHTDLYDFAANVEGAEEIFKVLQATVEQKNKELADEIVKRFAELDATLAPYRKDDGYVLYTELKEDEVKKLSQAIDALAEPLSKVGSVVEG